MFWQWIIVGMLIAASAFYVGRQVWRTWFGKTTGGCGGGCACAGKPKQAGSGEQPERISVEQITQRLRQRPR
jgi:FeoB-associated Cys-rich membrane protein